MKLVLERPSPILSTDLVMCEVVKGPDFGCVWHHHPEVEITLVRQGGTERWVGDRLSPLKSGDLVLLGPDLPHDYRNDRATGKRPREVNAVVIQFLPTLLGQDWLSLPGMSPVRDLLSRSRRGLAVTGATHRWAAPLVPQIARAGGLRRVILLLELLDGLARSPDLQEIASPGFDLSHRGAASDRVGNVCEHIRQHLGEDIYMADLSRMAGLSESAFSRMFRKSTGRTVPQYINELRVARACRLLAETDQTVGEIAYNSGYRNPAHFQRQFSRFTRRSPLSYREHVRAGR